MFFPRMVLPTKGACLLFYLLGITQPSPKGSVFDVMRTTVGGRGVFNGFILRSEAAKSIATSLLKQWQSSA